MSIEKTDSEWTQGIFLELDRGNFFVRGSDVGKCIVLWENTAPRQMEIELQGTPRKLFVRNVWNTGNGAMQYGHFGAAMIVDHLHDGRRYRCNDGKPDEDFDDIVFSLKLT